MSKENLTHREAINKLKEISEKARVCLFATNLKRLPIESRPMVLKECDEDGNLWFISGSHSKKNTDIEKDNRVQLFFTNKDSSEYLSVYGHAFIYKDRKTIEEKWSNMVKPWFESKEDPSVSIIRVAPLNSYYWDTKNGKIAGMLSYAWATLTGKEDGVLDQNVEGDIKI